MIDFKLGEVQFCIFTVRHLNDNPAIVKVKVQESKYYDLSLGGFISYYLTMIDYYAKSKNRFVCMLQPSLNGYGMHA